MPSYVIFGLFIATLVMPTIIALGAAIYGNKYTRYFTGAIGITLAVGLHAGIAYYSFKNYPTWWNNSNWPLGAIYIPGTIGNVVGVLWSFLDLAEEVDKERAQRRNTSGNVHSFRRSA